MFMQRAHPARLYIKKQENQKVILETCSNILNLFMPLKSLMTLEIFHFIFTILQHLACQW